MPTVQQRAQQFDFYKYLRILWRRKWLLIIPLSVSIPLCLVAAIYYPTEYQSRAILETQVDRPQVEEGAAPTNVVRDVQAVSNQMLNWNVVREIVLGRKVDFGREIDADDRRQLERVYHEVLRRVRVRPLSSRHLEVSYQSTSAERNAALVNEVVKRFVGENRKEAQEKAKLDLQYYREKLGAAKANMSEIDNQIREFTQANPWLRDDTVELHRDYKDVEQQEAETRQQIAELEATLAEARKSLAKEKPEIVTRRPATASQEVVDARRAVEGLQQYFREVSERFTPAHRVYQDAKRRFEEAAARLKEIDKGEEEIEETQPNPEYAKLQEKIAVGEKSLEKLNARKLALNKRAAELYDLLRKAPELLAEKKRLNEGRASADAVVADFERGYRATDTEVQRLMTEAFSTKFKVIEYARDDRTPVKSTKLKIIALGTFIGLLTGAGLIVLVEYLDQTFKTIDDAREYLGLPALGVIPAIFTPRDHRRRLWFRVLAASSAVFVVGVAVAVYLMVPATRDYLHVAWIEFQEIMQTW